MTEVQARYRSDAQVEFEDRLLEDGPFFMLYAEAYMRDTGQSPAKFEGEPFFKWSWDHREEVEG